ncbi:Nephrocystin-8, partial [Intoshia linei]
MSSSEIIGIMDKSNSKSIKNELRTVQMHNNAISKISRYELEDLYVRLHDENINLKTKNNTNEKKLQKLAVRVIRLSKNSNEKEDVEIEDYDNAMKNARKLQKYNVELTKQLNLLKKEKVRPYRTLNKTLTKKPNNQQILQSRITRELVIDELEQKIVNLQKSEKHITQEFDIKENEYQNDIHNLKKQMNNTNRKNFNENINLIKLQREIKEKGTKLIALQQKYGELQKKQEILHNNHNGLIHELDRATEALNEEQRKVSKYQESIKKLDIKSIKLQEMEDRILEIENENSVLRDANKNMVSSAFNMDREREWQKREKILKVQIAQLEATLRSDNSEKGCVLDQLIQSKDELSKQTDQHNKLKAEYFQLKHEYEEQKQKLDYLNKNCDQWGELDDTIMVVNMKKMENGKVTEEKKMDYRKTIKCLRIEHAETILELEKTRNMLIVQNKILKSYQKEIDTIKNKFNIEKETSDQKIHEMSYLLDMRAIRLKKLQKQIRDIAYGTKTTKIKELDELLVDSETDKIDDGSKSYNLDLDRGDNLIEFKLCSINLNTDMTKLMDDEAPLLFCTWDFYEFDTQVSKVVCGTNSAINCCSNYIVKIDAFAIQYLFDSCISIQMYHLLGTQCKLLAIGNVPIIDLFKQSDKIVRCTTNLVCHENGEIVGELDYTLRMKYAMEHSLRLFNEKTKAQTYIENMQHNDIEKYENIATSKIPLEKSKITISILSCHNIKSKNDIQPNLYAGYQFYTFKEHLTNKINSSENPEFNDSCSFTIDNNTRFSNYIQNQKLQIYLIDDNSNIKDEYVCMAHVDVKDIFEKEELYHKIALKDS